MADAAAPKAAFWYSGLLETAGDNAAATHMMAFAAAHPTTHDPMLLALEVAQQNGLDMAGIFRKCDGGEAGPATAMAVVGCLSDLGAQFDEVQRAELVQRLNSVSSTSDLGDEYGHFGAAIKSRALQAMAAKVGPSSSLEQEKTTSENSAEPLIEEARAPVAAAPASATATKIATATASTPSPEAAAESSTKTSASTNEMPVSAAPANTPTTAHKTVVASEAKAIENTGPKLWYWPAIKELAKQKPETYKAMVAFHEKHPDVYDPVIYTLETAKRLRWRMIDVFRMNDKDKSGGITVKEFVSMGDFGEGMSKVQRKELVRRMDASGDGEVQYSEFVTPFKPTILLEIQMACDREVAAAVVAQRSIRGMLQRRRFLQKKLSVIKIQAAFRGYLTRKRGNEVPLIKEETAAAAAAAHIPAEPQSEDNATVNDLLSDQCVTQSEVSMEAEMERVHAEAEVSENLALVEKEAKFDASRETGAAKALDVLSADIDEAPTLEQDEEGGFESLTLVQPQAVVGQGTSVDITNNTASSVADVLTETPKELTRMTESVSLTANTDGEDIDGGRSELEHDANVVGLRENAASMDVSDMIARAQAVYEAARSHAAEASVEDDVVDIVEDEEEIVPFVDPADEAARLVQQHFDRLMKQEEKRRAEALRRAEKVQERSIEYIYMELVDAETTDLIAEIARRAWAEVKWESELEAEQDAVAVAPKRITSIAKLDEQYNAAMRIAQKTVRINVRRSIARSTGQVEIPPEFLGHEVRTDLLRPPSSEGVAVARLVVHCPPDMEEGSTTEVPSRAPQGSENAVVSSIVSRWRSLAAKAAINPHTTGTTVQARADIRNRDENRENSSQGTRVAQLQLPSNNELQNSSSERGEVRSTVDCGDVGSGKAVSPFLHDGRQPEHDRQEITSPYKYTVPLPAISPTVDTDNDEVQALLRQQQLIDYQLQKVLRDRAAGQPRVSPVHSRVPQVSGDGQQQRDIFGASERTLAKINERERKRIEEQMQLKKGRASTRMAYDTARREKQRKRKEHDVKTTLLHQMEQDVRGIEQQRESRVLEKRALMSNALAREARLQVQVQLEHSRKLSLHDVAAEVIQRAYRKWLSRRDQLAAERAEEALVNRALDRTKGQKVYRPLRMRESQAAMNYERREYSKRAQSVLDHMGSNGETTDEPALRQSTSPDAGTIIGKPDKKQWLAQRRAQREQQQNTTGDTVSHGIKSSEQSTSPIPRVVENTSNLKDAVQRSPRKQFADGANGRLRILAEPVDAPSGPLAVYERSKRDVMLKELWREERVNSATKKELAPCTFMPEVHGLPEDWGEDRGDDKSRVPSPIRSKSRRDNIQAKPRPAVPSSIPGPPSKARSVTNRVRARNSKTHQTTTPISSSQSQLRFPGPPLASKMPTPAAPKLRPRPVQESHQVDWADLPPPPPQPQ
mmetsp:Transcript_5081/g.15475  ORF Transcript_5081/g.15475 Transcript_5081/m.15475 type:complete len:1428 (+) Transcript_5081:29-4312(+)